MIICSQVRSADAFVTIAWRTLPDPFAEFCSEGLLKSPQRCKKGSCHRDIGMRCATANVTSAFVSPEKDSAVDQPAALGYFQFAATLLGPDTARSPFRCVHSGEFAMSTSPPPKKVASVPWLWIAITVCAVDVILAVLFR